jgi:hypothetical protein
VVGPLAPFELALHLDLHFGEACTSRAEGWR